ncbi:hypothetical protein EOD39_6993 [Acipenser ruthenus]|uniref:Uncharacterized protein n=1 Tax=Acipenser ruthenus TaxID=7906 RepID=A0A662YZ91_ACIRT|nr:hypothetical protein EOD39_6993 [Acipenser ruthenus]
MDFKELIEEIKRNTAAQVEQTKKWRQELGLKDPEPTELDLLLQRWEQTGGAPLTQVPEPREEEPPLPEPRGEEPEPGEEVESIRFARCPSKHDFIAADFLGVAPCDKIACQDDPIPLFYGIHVMAVGVYIL